MKVALVHDYLTQRGGAERVVLSLTRAFPEAPIYTALYDRSGTFPEFASLEVRPLWLDRIQPLRRRHRLALPLLPAVFATARIDADVVVCSTSGWAHEVQTEVPTIAYCHSPAKWLYRRDDYLGRAPSRLARAGLRVLDPVLRFADSRAAASVHTYIANSSFIARQIQEIYGRQAVVVNPPPTLTVDGPLNPVPDLASGFFLTVSRLLPYKNVSSIVEAFRSLPAAHLVVAGAGTERVSLAAGAPANVHFVGEVDDATLRWLYDNCRALVTASREDFGLTPLEAASFGKPVAALRWGGFMDTVVEGDTGVFFDAPTPRQVEAAIRRLGAHEWDRHAIRAHAGTFSEWRFIARIQAIVAQSSSEAIAQRRGGDRVVEPDGATLLHRMP